MDLVNHDCKSALTGVSRGAGLRYVCTWDIVKPYTPKASQRKILDLQRAFKLPRQLYVAQKQAWILTPCSASQGSDVMVGSSNTERSENPIFAMSLL